MALILLASGGPTYAHDHAATAVTITELLTQAGHVIVATTTHFSEFTEVLAETRPDAIVMHALWWRMVADRYADIRDEWAYESPTELREALAGFVASGGALVALHTSTICFDDWAGWGEIVGGQWNWDRSFHPPLGPVSVVVGPVGHTVTDGLADYETIDEVYAHLDLQPDVVPLAFGLHSDGSRHPILWTRFFGAGRVAYLGLGHDSKSLSTPATAEILRRCVAWAVDSSEASLSS